MRKVITHIKSFVYLRLQRKTTSCSLTTVSGCLGGALDERRTRHRKVAGRWFDFRPGHYQVN